MYMRPVKAPKPSSAVLNKTHPESNDAVLRQSAMIRTQIYLTRAEHEFLQAEAVRRGEAMSAVIRGLVDEKMAIPEEAWISNHMLEPTPEVPGWESPEDAALNH